MERTQRFFLKTAWSGYTEVGKETWIRAERSAGFWPKGEDRGQPATGGFGNGSVSGSVVSWPLGDEALKNYELYSPDLFALLMEPTT